MSLLSRALLALGAALLSTPALAGVGATASVSALTDGTSWVPSLDFRSGPVLVQVHALELVGGLTQKQLHLGLDGAYLVTKAKAAEEVEGVVMLGAGVRLQSGTEFDFEARQFNVVAKARFGAESKKGAGIGLYAVPTLGVSNFGLTEGVAFVYGGGLELSAWLK